MKAIYQPPQPVQVEATEITGSISTDGVLREMFRNNQSNAALMCHVFNNVILCRFSKHPMNRLVLERCGLLKEQSILIDFRGKHRGFNFDFFGCQNTDRIQA